MAKKSTSGKTSSFGDIITNAVSDEDLLSSFASSPKKQEEASKGEVSDSENSVQTKNETPKKEKKEDPVPVDDTEDDQPEDEEETVSEAPNRKNRQKKKRKYKTLEDYFQPIEEKAEVSIKLPPSNHRVLSMLSKSSANNITDILANILIDWQDKHEDEIKDLFLKSMFH